MWFVLVVGWPVFVSCLLWTVVDDGDVETALCCGNSQACAAVVFDMCWSWRFSVDMVLGTYVMS